MAATTFATWYAAFRDLSVTGVTNLTESPLDVPSAKRPCKWVDVVGMGGGPFVVGKTGGWPTFTCRVVVLMEPWGQGRHATRWSDAVSMMDTLNGAITGMTKPVKGALSWTMSLESDFVGSGYFAVVATVEGEG
jgi:hypothetical protein